MARPPRMGRCHECDRTIRIKRSGRFPVHLVPGSSLRCDGSDQPTGIAPAAPKRKASPPPDVTAGIRNPHAVAVRNIMARRKEARKLEPFSDSYTTDEAEISVRVGDPWGAVEEEVMVKIDCNGEVSLVATEIDLVITMLEKARDDLRKRSGA